MENAKADFIGANSFIVFVNFTNVVLLWELEHQYSWYQQYRLGLNLR